MDSVMGKKHWSKEEMRKWKAIVKHNKWCKENPEKCPDGKYRSEKKKQNNRH